MLPLRLRVNFHPFSRIPGRDAEQFADSLPRFHDTVMQPMGLAA